MSIAHPETLKRLRNMSPEDMAAMRQEVDAKFGPSIAAGPYGDGPGFGTGGVPGPLPPLPDDNAKDWLQDLLFRSTGNAGGNTLAQDIAGGNIGAGSSNAALGFLQGVGKKLGNFLNVAPGNPGQPRDMQGTELIPDSQNPGKYIHPGAQQIRDRNEQIRLGF